MKKAPSGAFFRCSTSSTAFVASTTRRDGGAGRAMWQSEAPLSPASAAVPPDPNQAKTPAVSCMRADTSPSWCKVSPKVMSSCVNFLK